MRFPRIEKPTLMDNVDDLVHQFLTTLHIIQQRRFDPTPFIHLIFRFSEDEIHQKQCDA